MTTLEEAQYIIDTFIKDGSKVINVCTYPDRLEADILTTNGKLRGVSGLFAANLKKAQRVNIIVDIRED